MDTILTGQFKRKIFTAPDGNFHIFYFKPDTRLDCVVTIKGQGPELSGTYALYGEWQMIPPHGPRFKVETMTRYQVHKDGGNHYLKKLKGMLVA